MTPGSASLRRTAARAAAALLVLAALLASASADLGGGFWSAYGPCRASVAGGGFRPVEVLANLRFDFGGAGDDTSGTGTLMAYDPSGQILEASLPFSWTTRNGRAGRLDLASPQFEEYLAGLVGTAAGKGASVALDSASARCALSRGDDDLRAALKARGTVVLGEDPPRRLAVNIRVR